MSLVAATGRRFESSTRFEGFGFVRNNYETIFDIDGVIIHRLGSAMVVPERQEWDFELPSEFADLIPKLWPSLRGFTLSSRPVALQEGIVQKNLFLQRGLVLLDDLGMEPSDMMSFDGGFHLEDQIIEVGLVETTTDPHVDMGMWSIIQCPCVDDRVKNAVFVFGEEIAHSLVKCVGEQINYTHDVYLFLLVIP